MIEKLQRALSFRLAKSGVKDAKIVPAITGNLGLGTIDQYGNQYVLLGALNVGSPVDLTSSLTAGYLDVSSHGYVYNGSAWTQLLSAPDTDADAVSASGLLATLSRGQEYNGASWDRLRTPAAFYSVQATALGTTAIVTPGAGLKFRLMRYQVEITDNATLAAAGILTMNFYDNGVAIGPAHDTYVPAVALNNGGVLYRSGWIDLGNGYVQAAAATPLQINLSAALATGNVRVNIAGTIGATP